MYKYFSPFRFCGGGGKHRPLSDVLVYYMQLGGFLPSFLPFPFPIHNSNLQMRRPACLPQQDSIISCSCRWRSSLTPQGNWSHVNAGWGDLRHKSLFRQGGEVVLLEGAGGFTGIVATRRFSLLFAREARATPTSIIPPLPWLGPASPRLSVPGAVAQRPSVCLGGCRCRCQPAGRRVDCSSRSLGHPLAPFIPEPLPPAPSRQAERASRRWRPLR